MSIATARRREQRRKKKLRCLPREKAFLQRKAAFRQFPEVIYRDEGAPQALVDAVKMSVRQFVINHAVALSPYETDLLHLIRRVGMRRAHELVSEQLLQNGVSVTRTSAALFMPFATMGDSILTRLSAGTVKGYLPYSAFFLRPGVPRENTLLVWIRSLCRETTRHGTAYFSPYRPTVKIGERHLRVAFSDHAVRRICERSVGTWEKYLDLTYAFVMIHNTVYFEPWKTDRGEDGFVVFKERMLSDSERITVGSLVEKAGRTGECVYRVGYCPAVIDGDLLRAKTLLLPGMVGTPEYTCLIRRGKTYMERADWRRKASDLGFRRLEDPESVELLRYLQENGFPQIMSFDHEICRDEV